MDLGRDQAPDKVVRQQLNLLDQVYCQRGDHHMRLLSQSPSSSNVNLHRMAPSHRGMTYDIIEHPLPGEDESLMPLPSKGSDEEKNAGLDVLGEGLEIRYNGPSSKPDMDAAAARADYP